MPLTAAACRTAKPTDKAYKITDAAGLYLLVQPNGSRLWRMDYTFAGKRRTAALGKYPAISLAEARAERQLAHVPLDKVRSSYNAAEWWPQRVALMTLWSNRLDALCAQRSPPDLSALLT